MVTEDSNAGAMAVFFDKHVQFPRPSAGVRVHHAVEWHNTHAILAVASKNETTDADGSVNFYLDEGDLVEDASIQRSIAVECMQWHPTNRIVAIGWKSGELTTYNDHAHTFFEQSSIHRSPVTIVQWNKNGSRLISGDKSGLLVVWSVDSRGQLHPSPIHQHRLHSPVTHCVMLHPLSESSSEHKGSVLDSFSWQRKSAAHLAESIQDPIACFCATEDGAMFFMNHSGMCVERFRLEGPVHSLLIRDDMELMAVLTQDMGLSQFTVGYDGQTNQIMNAKLSTQNKASSLIWVADGVLASCSGESAIRFWDFEKSENYMLGVQTPGGQATREEVVMCISYNKDKGVLAGGTSGGSVVMWRWSGGNTDRLGTTDKPLEGPDKWEVLTTSLLAGPAIQVKWGSKKNLLVANCKTTVQILSEHVMNAHYNHQVSAVQVSPIELQVECHNTGLIHSVRTDIHIKGVFVTQEDVTVWNGKRLAVYAFSQDKSVVRNAGSFSTETQTAVLYEHNVYTIEKASINVRAFQGTVKQVLSFSEQEGCPISLSVGGHFLVAGTDTGYVKAWDLTRREAKLHCSSCLSEGAPESTLITSVQCNCNGTKISVISESADSQLHQLTLWDIDSDSVRLFSPQNLLNNTQDPPLQTEPSTAQPQLSSLPELPEASLNEQKSLLREIADRDIVKHFWDPNEPGTLVLEARNSADGAVGKKSSSWSNRKNGKYSQANVLLVSLFVTQDQSVLISDVMPTDHNYNGLVGFSVPFFYINQKGGGRSSPITNQPTPSSTSIVRVTMRGFVGLEASDQATLHAMVEFGYHSTIGNMDEAFKAIKLIKSETVWENMARMCVKTQRLDVAAVCLGNMGSARAAKAIREATKIPEPEARLAVLAVQLGMLDEAEDLYRRSNRYDLLNQFYQASGKWSKAIEVAELNDRMHLKTTYYNYGKHAEAIGEFTAAINCYEKSGTHQFEVPRMLLDDPLELENYVMKSKDKGVRKWWAEYLESMGEWEQAMQFYETAKDYYSLVRILCFNGQVERAIELAEESSSKAACYHLARRLSMETEEQDVRKAIHFYTKAQCYTPALQLAKESGLDNELMHLALLSSQEDMIDAAKYYEENQETLDKAIMLYHKSGEISKALELCFQHRQFEVLHQIAEDLSEDSSSEMTKRVADYFMEHGQFDKAVELLVKSKQFHDALELCMTHNIKLTEDMVERMSIPKGANESQSDTEVRVRLLERLADCCAEQGSYHLATKKYTQAGNKTKAMKVLLKSGDTEKVVFFAGVSRQKDIYVMAANYLQSLDWRNNPEIMKNIISFYTKGRALESLAGFYDACAQVEIDEYQNYAKALGALNEALKSLSKAKTKNPAALEAKVNFLTERVDLIKRFADARSVYESDPDECIKQCQSLLDEPSLDTAVRMGDVYGLMIEHFGQAGSYEQAYSLMEEMRQRLPTVNMAYYVDIRTIESIHSGLGIPLGRGIGGGVSREAGEESEGDESVGEEVEEGF